MATKYVTKSAYQRELEEKQNAFFTNILMTIVSFIMLVTGWYMGNTYSVFIFPLTGALIGIMITMVYEIDRKIAFGFLTLAAIFGYGTAQIVTTILSGNIPLNSAYSFLITPEIVFIVLAVLGKIGTLATSFLGTLGVMAFIRHIK